jgi:DNA-binding MarR family transcriptional regulator
MDFFDELHELALGSRLKRLSELFIHEATEIYQHFGLDIQPKWFTLLALIHHKRQVSVVEAADYLGLSQPAITQFCQQLAKRELIDFVICKKDARRRLITLSKTGQESVKTMLPIWQAVQDAAQEISREYESDLYLAIQKCENALKRKTLKQRTIEAYHVKA